METEIDPEVYNESDYPDWDYNIMFFKMPCLKERVRGKAFPQYR